MLTTLLFLLALLDTIRVHGKKMQQKIVFDCLNFMYFLTVRDHTSLRSFFFLQLQILQQLYAMRLIKYNFVYFLPD